MKKFILGIVFIFGFILPLLPKDKGCGFYGEFGKSINSDIAYTDIELHYVFKFWQIELIPYGGVKTCYFYYKHNNVHLVTSFYRKENKILKI